MHIVGTGVYGWYGESLHGLEFDEPRSGRAQETAANRRTVHSAPNATRMRKEAME